MDEIEVAVLLYMVRLTRLLIGGGSLERNPLADRRVLLDSLDDVSRSHRRSRSNKISFFVLTCNKA